MLIIDPQTRASSDELKDFINIHLDKSQLVDNKIILVNEFKVKCFKLNFLKIILLGMAN
jgi:hypothetical protein